MSPRELHGPPAAGREIGPRRRTKVVATVGPASRDPETLAQLIAGGVDVFRLNFSHGTAPEHAESIRRIRAVSAELDCEVGVLGDLPGPKLRLGLLKDNVAVLHSGSTVVMAPGGDWEPGSAERLPVQWDGFTGALAPSDTVFLADGRVRLKVRSVAAHEAVCEVEAGGSISSHQGVNLPGADAELPDAGANDIAWIDFACDNDVDLLAVSFVRRPADLELVEAKVRARGHDIPLIAKIEKPQAAEHAEEIIEAAGSGIMVARGDLGVELPLEMVPGTQKRLIALAGRRSKPSITATQMLATMVRASRPTRAEVTDVANAIYDGTDAVMLSEETAIGEHPVEAVRVMDRIACETERWLPYRDWNADRVIHDDTDIAAAVAQVTVAATSRLRLAAIVVPTSSGRTARLVSSHRPWAPVLAVSRRIETVRRMNLLFGVQAVFSEHPSELGELLDHCAEMARQAGVARSGDLIAVTAGLPGQGLGTNLFEVHLVP